MKLTTYGMWEEPRQNLVYDLLEDAKLNGDETEINRVLLEPVITKIIDASYSYQLKLQKEGSPLSLKERTLATYEVALATMLPILAESLGKAEELLQTHVEKFITASLALSKENIDYLMELAMLSREIKRNGVKELYGEDFSNTYPELAQALALNDSQLIERATKAVTLAIHKNCPDSVIPMMQEHIKYMNEISSQKMADLQFAEKFKATTGMTMEQYKAQIRLSQLSGKSLTSLAGHFKLGTELKEQVPEEPGLSASWN